MKETKIEWATSTWNPWYGCHKVSSGCKNCYMFRDMNRFGRDPNIVKRSKTRFNDPLKWKEPERIFVCSWSDFFIEEADKWREEAWEIMVRNPHHTFMILTKRSERIKQCLPKDWGDGYPNVWLGVTIEDQKYERRLIELVRIPAIIWFISYEPVIGVLNLKHHLQQGMVEWVISGGESGPNCRPANPDWFRSIRDQCKDAGISYFHKQHGGKTKIDGAWGGRELDGRTWNELPVT